MCPEGVHFGSKRDPWVNGSNGQWSMVNGSMGSMGPMGALLGPFGTLFQTPRDMVNADKRPLAFQCVSRRGSILGPKGVNWGYPPKHHFGVTFWYAKSMGRLGSVLGSLLGSVLGPRFGTSFQYTLPWQGVSDLSVQKGVPFWVQKRVQNGTPSKHRISINTIDA